MIEVNMLSLTSLLQRSAGALNPNWMELTNDRFEMEKKLCLDSNVKDQCAGVIYPMLQTTTCGKVFSIHVEEDHIYQYNRNGNLFDRYINLPNKAKSMCYIIPTKIQMAVDKTQKNLIIYELNDTKSVLHYIDVETNKHNVIDNVPYAQYIIMVDKLIYFFDNNQRYWITQKKQNKIEVLGRLSMTNMIRKSGMVLYIPSRKCIVMLGGRGYDTMKTNMREIWIFWLASQKWTTIKNIAFDRYNFGAVVTSDEKYILIFGGWINGNSYIGKPTNEISILQITENNDWKMKQCSIKCPWAGTCMVTKSYSNDRKDAFLVVGYIKICFQQPAFKDIQIPPIPIVRLIQKWYNHDNIHYISADRQFEIHEKHILLNMR